MNPYLVLGVGLEATDHEIRQAYVQAIKSAPPERDPQRFQQFTAAYELIRDESRRHQYTLFRRTTYGHSPAEVLRLTLTTLPRPQPLEYEAMQRWLRSLVTS
jgi:DnaJ-class molecular chaperone